MTRWRGMAGLALAAGMGLSGCATAPGHGGASGLTWREVTQVPGRFAVFVSQPAERGEGGRVTFRMVFVYRPGEVMFDGRDVAWQEYSAMTIDCAARQVRPGPRTRYGADGTGLGADEDMRFADVLAGSSVSLAADRLCGTGQEAAGRILPDGPGWMAEARRGIPAPER